MHSSRMITALLLTVMLVPALHAQNSRAHSEAALRQLEHQLATDAERLDWRLWDQVVAPDWTMIDPTGRLIDKATALDTAKKGKAAMASSQIAFSVSLYDLQVRFLRDDIALVTAQATYDYSRAGNKNKLTFRNMDIFEQRQGKWLVVASQATPVKSAH